MSENNEILRQKLLNAYNATRELYDALEYTMNESALNEVNDILDDFLDLDLQLHGKHYERRALE